MRRARNHYRRRGPYVPAGLIVRLDNRAQVSLFTEELSGQISDGVWENSNPFDHYKWVPSADKVMVAAEGERTGVFYPYCTPNSEEITWVRYTTPRRYNFLNSVLLDAVGDRMIEQVKTLPDHEWYTMKSLKMDLKAITSSVRGPR